MHVGMSLIFQGSADRSDAQVYRDDIALGDRAEALGFDSLWGVEHHFTGYTMCPDVLQYLTYMAGRTRTIKLGSMVVVLPWHDPVRVTEQVAMLDVLSQGRFLLGMGRGLGRVEFDGFRVPMGESRGRFVEAAQLILDGLEHGEVSFEGQFYCQPRRTIRPSPVSSFKGRSYASAVSPESFEIMARLGVGILIVPQKPWDSVVDDLEAYRVTFRHVNGTDAPPTAVVGWVFCDEDPKRAEDLAIRYIGGYYRSVLEHYELMGEHLATTSGYEFYAEQAKAIAKRGADAATAFYTGLQVWGTPAQCIEKIEQIQELSRNDTFIAVFSYAGMPHDEARRNQALFAREVMPALKAMTVPEPATR